VLRDLGNSGRRRINGTEVHWVDAGTGAPVVLVHGLSDTHRTWRNLIPFLVANGRRVISVDLPGHGLSGRPNASYTLEFHAKAVSDLARALRLGPFDLVGHAYGGDVAMAMCRLKRRRVRTLSLIASAGGAEEIGIALRVLALPGMESIAQASLSIGTRVGLRVAAGGSAPSEERDWHAWQNATAGTGRAVHRSARHLTERKRSRGRKSNFGRLPPIRLFSGDADPVHPYVHSVRLAAAIPGTRLYRFRGIGHFPHLECAEALADALSR
jgi:pimeloyl-ACP methyl ester carboxylesterase